jgi:hypothetical protein
MYEFKYGKIKDASATREAKMLHKNEIYDMKDVFYSTFGNSKGQSICGKTYYNLTYYGWYKDFSGNYALAKCDCGNPAFIKTIPYTRTKCDNCRKQFTTKFHRSDDIKNIYKHNHVYVGSCRCGNKIYGDENFFKYGKNICSHDKQKGIETIAAILIKNNIPFQRNVQRDDFTFDFWIDNSYFIEYDTKRHFYAQDNHKKDFIKTQERDKKKNDWCAANQLPLIRIPFALVNDLELRDLQLNSSDFVINFNQSLSQ